MGKRCHNNIQLVSTEVGISHVLKRFHEVMGLDLPVDGDCPLMGATYAETLAYSVRHALDIPPSALATLFEKDGTSLLETCLFIAYPYQRDVWVLHMSLRTDGLPIERAFDDLYSCDAGYLFSNRWNFDLEYEPQEILLLWRNGHASAFEYSEADEWYGNDMPAAAYVRQVLGLESPLTEQAIRKLARADDVAELRKHADEKAVRDYATHADFNKLFKERRFDAYALLLDISSPRHLRYAPRDLGKCLTAFCEAGAGNAMDSFVKRYAWSDACIDKAMGILSDFLASHPGNEVASACLSQLESRRARGLDEDAAAQSGALAEVSALEAGETLRIGRNSFRSGVPSGLYRGNTAIKSVVCESGIIGAEAFAGCTGLETFEVNCHSGLVEIGDGCFSGCSKLVSFKTTGYKISKLGSKVFDGCESLRMLSLQLDKASLKANALGSLPYLEKVSVSGSGRISKNAFAGCTALKTVRIGKYVTLNKGALSELGEDVVVRR